MNKSFSQILQPLINQSIQIFEIIHFSLEPNKIRLHIDITDGNELEVDYNAHGKNQYIDEAINDFVMLIKDSILIKQLIFGGAQQGNEQKIQEFFEKFKKFPSFFNFPRKLNVVELNIELALCQEDLLDLFPLFSAGNLENLNFRKINVTSRKLVETDHWKLAKRVWIGDSDLQLKDFLHFDKCSIERFLVNEDEVLVLVENCLRKFPSFEQFSYIPIQPNGNSAVSQCMENYKNSEIGRKFDGYQLSVPGSKYYLNIDNGTFRVVIRKMECF